MDYNILILVMDSVRARNTSLHNHVNETTPFLSRFASEQATTYTQARAPGVRSITSHASLFTGLHVNEHCITSADRRLRPGSTVFETLQDDGYSTAVFSENVWITDVDIGLKQGFDHIVGPQDVPFPEALNPRKFVAQEGKGAYANFVREALSDQHPIKSLANGVFTKAGYDFARFLPGGFNVSSPGKLYADRLLSWVDNTDTPWAACVNLMDAHLPYRPKPEFNRWGDDSLKKIEDDAPDKWELHAGTAKWWRQKAREAAYDGAICQTDSYVKHIIETLDEYDELEDTLVVITSDHGEGFGERSRVRGTRVAGHNVSMHDVLLHVPLVVKFPGQEDPKVIRELATLAQFPDAALSATRGETAADEFVPDDEVTAISYSLTEDTQLRARALNYCDEIEEFEAISRVVYENTDDGYRKYITCGNKEATVKIRNAQTSYKLSNSGGERVSEVFDNMEDAGVRESAGGMDKVDDATYARLEDLGYV